MSSRLFVFRTGSARKKGTKLDKISILKFINKIVNNSKTASQGPKTSFIWQKVA